MNWTYVSATIGFLLFVFSFPLWRELVLAFKSYSYCKTEGEIVRCDVSQSESGIPEWLTVKYLYRVEGKQYTAKRLAYGMPSILNVLVKKFGLGEKVEVFYDIRNPKEAVLIRGIQHRTIVGLVVSLLCWALLILYSAGLLSKYITPNETPGF